MPDIVLAFGNKAHVRCWPGRAGARIGGAGHLGSAW
jgi:hypothetical protein